MKELTAPVLAFVYDRQMSPTAGVLVLRLEVCKIRARDEGWEIAGEWIDQDEHAFSDDERPAFDAMVEAMTLAQNSGRRVLCLVADWSRLSRDQGARGAFLARVRTAGGYTATGIGDSDEPGGSVPGLRPPQAPVSKDIRLRPMCEARGFLASELAEKAVRFEDSAVVVPDSGDVERILRCTLQEHTATTAHHALVLELGGVDGGAVWARWNDDHKPLELVKLQDCPGAGGEACNEYAGHPGGHSFQIRDRWAPWPDGLTLPPS